MAGKANFNIVPPNTGPITVKTNMGTMKAELKWGAGFANKKTGALEKAQFFVDSECLNRMKYLTPRDTGAMIKSGILGTVPGSGKIEYTSPYARRQYYENRGNGKQGGRLWFERMKAQEGNDIRRKAEAIATGKVDI